MLTVTGDLTNSSLNSKLVKVLQDLEIKYETTTYTLMSNTTNYKLNANTITTIGGELTASKDIIVFVLCAVQFDSKVSTSTASSNKVDFYVVINNQSKNGWTCPLLVANAMQTMISIHNLYKGQKLKIQGFTNVSNGVTLLSINIEAFIFNIAV